MFATSTRVVARNHFQPATIRKSCGSQTRGPERASVKRSRSEYPDRLETTFGNRSSRSGCSPENTSEQSYSLTPVGTAAAGPPDTAALLWLLLRSAVTRCLRGEFLLLPCSASALCPSGDASFVGAGQNCWIPRTSGMDAPQVVPTTHNSVLHPVLSVSQTTGGFALRPSAPQRRGFLLRTSRPMRPDAPISSDCDLSGAAGHVRDRLVSIRPADPKPGRSR